MSNWNDTREAYRDAKDMERWSILGDDELPQETTNELIEEPEEATE